MKAKSVKAVRMGKNQRFILSLKPNKPKRLPRLDYAPAAGYTRPDSLKVCSKKMGVKILTVEIKGVPWAMLDSTTVK